MTSAALSSGNKKRHKLLWEVLERRRYGPANVIETDVENGDGDGVFCGNASRGKLGEALRGLVIGRERRRQVANEEVIEICDDDYEEEEKGGEVEVVEVGKENKIGRRVVEKEVDQLCKELGELEIKGERGLSRRNEGKMKRRPSRVIVIDDDSSEEEEEEEEEGEKEVGWKETEEDTALVDKSLNEITSRRKQHFTESFTDLRHSRKIISAQGSSYFLNIKAGPTFSQNRETLSQLLLEYYDLSIFEGRLLHQSSHKLVHLHWNPRLSKTAGRAYLTHLPPPHQNTRSSRIELSNKVIDNGERLYQTLAHELCHAANWIFDGVIKPPHGEGFKKWGRRFEKFDKRIRVRRCHSYEIWYKFVYKCGCCGMEYGRHTKSIDVGKVVCGKCKGRLRLEKNKRS